MIIASPLCFYWHHKCFTCGRLKQTVILTIHQYSMHTKGRNSSLYIFCFVLGWLWEVFTECLSIGLKPPNLTETHCNSPFNMKVHSLLLANEFCFCVYHTLAFCVKCICADFTTGKLWVAAILSPAVHSSVQLGFKDMSLSHETFGVCIAMASLRVYCLLLLMYVLDILWGLTNLVVYVPLLIVLCVCVCVCMCVCSCVHVRSCAVDDQSRQSMPMPLLL